MQAFLEFFEIKDGTELAILVFGLVAQSMFFMRFFVQWLASEKQRKSVMPNAFWWFSLAGGLMLLTYGFMRRDLVIILGQSVGVLIYVRNIWFIYGRKNG